MPDCDWLEVIGPPEPPTQEEYQRQRECLALWMFDDDLYENKLIWDAAWAVAKEENNQPWARDLLRSIRESYPRT